jgi:spermidine dehydrogenase
MRKNHDRDLGMKCPISRRDFLNGMAVTIGASLLPREAFALSLFGHHEHVYPPALTGLRGAHVGSFENAHRLRDGEFSNDTQSVKKKRELYDLVVVGAGISGLSAAHFYRKQFGPQARILLLDNHDDFGGHAKRNELRAAGRTLLGYGGTYSIESPAPYSAVAKGLIDELGIDVTSYENYVDKSLYRSHALQPRIFFDKETFGSDRLVIDPNPLRGGENSPSDSNYDARRWEEFLSNAPLSEQAKKDYQRLVSTKEDYFSGLSSSEKKARLARMSYAAFLTDFAKVDGEVLKLLQAAPHPLFGLGIDGVAAQDAWGLGYPGFNGLHLDPAPGAGMNRDAIPNEEADKYFFHFPDGNASIARLLVRSLIPGAMPGHNATDILTARADYSKLDRSRSSVRIRMNSTVVRVQHVGDARSATEVEVTYAHGSKTYSVRAKHCVLACWHNIIPYLCPDLPREQLEALRAAAKVPLLYTNVALRNWQSLKHAAVSSIYAPGSYYTEASLDLPVSIGEYHCAKSPDEPIIVHMMKTPNSPGMPSYEQHRLGRMELFVTPFEEIERKTREQLSRMLNGTAFDPARDIAAVTVNRWPHGYAYEYNSLFDKFWLEGAETPCERARKPFGRIAIANADAAAYAYTDAAIDQAYRAVQELGRQS